MKHDLPQAFDYAWRSAGRLRRRHVGGFCLLILALLTPAGLITPAAGQALNAQVIASDATDSLRPQIAADRNNQLHVVWYDTATGDRSLKYSRGTRNRDGSYAWAAPVDIFRPGGESTFIHPRIAIDRQNRIHLVWSWNFDIYYRYWAADSGPGSGSRPVVLGRGEYPAVATDAQNRAHVVWESEIGDYDILYRVSDGGTTFSAAMDISQNGQDSLSPDIVVDSNGTAHAVWYDKSSGAPRIYYAQRTNNSWSAPVTISDTFSYFPSIAADGNGCIHVTWGSTSTGRATYRRLCSGQWSNEHDLGAGSNARTAVGVTANGRIVAVWEHNDPRASLFYSVFDGSSWTSSQRLTSYSGARQMWPDAVGTPDGALAIVWQEDRGSGQFDPVFAAIAAPVAPAPVPAPPSAPPTDAPPMGVFDFANDAYRGLWMRTDSLVQRNAVPYSWIWGPQPFTPAVGEYYVQSPDNVRFVQYFDKSRMEINQPDAPRGPYYVSNGRLADELITGLMQVGDQQYEQRAPATIAVAGDPDNAFPLYRDLQVVYRRARPADQANELLIRAPDGSVQTQVLENANRDPSMRIVQRVNGIGIPKVFWDFMNQPGRVVENGATVEARPLIDWRYVIGEPLTEAYWTYIKVGGIDRGVLVQAFERRVLTFTPSNAPQFQVEMGNIGRHYFSWRYGTPLP